VIRGSVNYKRRKDSDRNQYRTITNATAADVTELFDGLVKPTAAGGNGDGAPVEIDASLIPSWKAWAARKFFKDRTNVGGEFEALVVQQLTLGAGGDQTVNDKYAGNLDGYQLFTNVYLEFYEADLTTPLTKKVGVGGPNERTITYFIADQVYRNTAGDYVIVENKLTEGTSLTVNQNFAKNTVKNFKVKTARTDLKGLPGGNLAAGTPLTEGGANSMSWIKVWDTDTGTAISGARKIK
jgi:hypothetical protein